jgi:hypothetical protein
VALLSSGTLTQLWMCVHDLHRGTGDPGQGCEQAEPWVSKTPLKLCGAVGWRWRPGRREEEQGLRWTSMTLVQRGGLGVLSSDLTPPVTPAPRS